MVDRGGQVRVGWVSSEFEARFASAACMDCTFIGEGFAIYCSTRGCSEWCMLTDEGRQSIIQNHKPNMCSELQTRLLSACRTQDFPPSRRVAYCLPSFYLLPPLSAVHVGWIRFVEILWIYIASPFSPLPLLSSPSFPGLWSSSSGIFLTSPSQIGFVASVCLISMLSASHLAVPPSSSFVSRLSLSAVRFLWIHRSRVHFRHPIHHPTFPLSDSCFALEYQYTHITIHLYPLGRQASLDEIVIVKSVLVYIQKHAMAPQRSRMEGGRAEGA